MRISSASRRWARVAVEIRRRRALVALAVALAAVLGACAHRPHGIETRPQRPSYEGGTEVSYEVQPEDSWDSIAESFFGDAANALRVAEDNGSDPSVAPEPGREVRVRIRANEVQRVRQIAEARGSYNTGVELMQEKGRDAEAREAFERALSKAPHFVDARYNLGLVLLRLGEPEDARKHLEKVVRQRPRDKDAHYALAASWFHEGSYPQAATELEAALRLDPEFLRARYTYALALERMGRAGEARAAWRAYLERDDSSAWADEARQHLRELGA